MKVYGLTGEEVRKAREQYGTNALSQPPQDSFRQKLQQNLCDPIIRILLAALAVNAVFACAGYGDWIETAGIAAAILLATLVSTWSEYSNESAFRRLQAEAARIRCRLWRDGRPVELPMDELVPGDAVMLAAGDKVPADGILLEGELSADQSALNGESEEAHKQAAPPDYAWADAGDDLSDSCRLYRGSVVTSGMGVMQAVRTGDASIYGRLACELKDDGRDGPLKLKLKGLAQSISKIGYGGAALIAAAVMLHKMLLAGGFAAYTANIPAVLNDLLQAAILAVIIVVMAVPEGLPLMIAIVSSVNMSKMLRDNVLVRKLAGIETAGSLNLLFTDKTGTITRGQLEVVRFIDGSLSESEAFDSLPDQIKELLYQQALLNTSAAVTEEGAVGGNMTEAALSSYLAGWRGSALPERLHFVPFNSTDKYSWARVQAGGERYCLLKGAPESLLARSAWYWTPAGGRQPLEEDLRERLNARMDRLAGESMRLLAFCTAADAGETVPAELTLIGIAAIRDEVRPEAAAAIRQVQRAGVQVVMITGDRRETAVAIAGEAGLLERADGLVLTSAELAELSDAEVKELLPRLRVVARALPMDKSRLVRLSQELNLVAGMTGDGVNDAPALKKADVGFAMGSGTEVAKEAGDIVILDDNFLSIRQAILYGRTIYHSICKFIVFQLTINFAAVGISFIAPFIGVERPLTITQILWINLVMDTLAALAFGGEPALEKYLQEKPRRRSEPIVSRPMLRQIVWGGGYMTLLAVIFFKSSWVAGLFRSDPENIYLYTGFFCTYIFLAVANAFNVRAEGFNLLDGLERNRGFVQVMAGILAIQVLLTYTGGRILRTAPLTGGEWLAVIGFALSIIAADLARKRLSRPSLRSDRPL